MSSIFEQGEYTSEQTCLLCGITALYRGWNSLCNRTCYYGLSELLDSYEKEDVAEPDPRLVTYFKKYPNPTHSFFFDKLKAYLSSQTSQ